MSSKAYRRRWSSLAIAVGCFCALSADAANPSPDPGAPIRSGMRSRGSLEWTQENVPKIFNIFGRQYPLSYCQNILAEASARILANPKDAVAYEIRGFARWRLEQFAGGRDDLNTSMRLSPVARNAQVYYILGECDSQEGDTKLAIQDFTKAIDLWTVKAPVNYYLRRAQAYSSIDDFKHAILDADKMIGNECGSAWPYEFRADLHAHLKQYPEAIKDYNKAMTFKQHEVKDLAMRATIYDALGNKKLADLDRQKLREITNDSSFGF